MVSRTFGMEHPRRGSHGCNHVTVFRKDNLLFLAPSQDRLGRACLLFGIVCE
jgi:hypothetical protein